MKNRKTEKSQHWNIEKLSNRKTENPGIEKSRNWHQKSELKVSKSINQKAERQKIEELKCRIIIEKSKK